MDQQHEKDTVGEEQEVVPPKDKIIPVLTEDREDREPLAASHLEKCEDPHPESHRDSETVRVQLFCSSNLPGFRLASFSGIEKHVKRICIRSNDEENAQKICSFLESLLFSGTREIQLNAKQLYSLQDFLQSFTNETISISKQRYKLWVTSNPNANRAPILFHFTKIESGIISFRKKTACRVLGAPFIMNGSQSKHKLNAQFHEVNFQRSMSEVMELIVTLNGNFEKNSTSNNLLFLLTFLMFSAQNSYHELSDDPQRENEFNSFHWSTVDWIFWVSIILQSENSATFQKNFQRRLTDLQSQLSTWLPARMDEFDMCDL